MKQTAELKKVHDQALKRADEAFVFERDNIREGREDQRFYAGDQWDEAAKKARGVDRPMLTVNRLGTFVRQVTGDLRQNTPAIKVLPSGGKASQDKADVFAGMIRSIEAKSDAAACYVKGASNAAQAGQGAFRVLTRYCSETSFDQEIVIQQIADPFGVLMDPLAQMPDKSDAAYGFVFERYSLEGFKAKWPDASDHSDFPIRGDGKGTSFQWTVGESVRVAEYWCRETDKRMIYQGADGGVTDVKPEGKEGADYRSREVEAVSIVSYMMSGKEILSGPHPWAGTVGIPICFIPGEEVTIDGATKRKGMVRDAKDPQKLLNYARTTDAEQTALQPKAPFIVTVDQIAGFEPIWKSAGTKNHPYLPFKIDPKAPGLRPERSQPPVMSTGLQNLSTQAGDDLHHVTGIYPASLGAKSNETSGVAIRARQHEGDTGSNYIIDNTRRAIAYAGRIICDLIPKIYDGERIVRVLEESGEHSMARINATEPQPDDPEDLEIIDTLDDGEYDVVVGTGPSYLTRQQEMADTIVELSRNLPQVGQVAADLLVKALNFPGGDEIAKRLERMIPPAVKEDNVPPPPPSPEDIEAAAKAQKAEAEAEGQRIENLTNAFTLLQALQGIPQQIAALQATVAQMSTPPQEAASQGQPGAGPQPPPMAGGPASPVEPGAGPALPPPDEGEPEIVDLEPIEGAPV